MIRTFAGDETGNIDMSPAQGRYLSIVSVEADGPALAHTMRELARGRPRELHARTDDRNGQRQVLEALAGVPFSIQVTRLEKARARPYIFNEPKLLYSVAWQLHARALLARISPEPGFLLVAPVGGKQVSGRIRRGVAKSAGEAKGVLTLDFREPSQEPLIQAADYCAWALQRDWERGDPSWAQGISEKLLFLEDGF